MKKILKSVFTIALVAAFAIGASQAFLSDTETSSGNTFTAGSIDLKIDNESWYYGPEGLVKRDDLSWDLDDLTGHLFFNYEDLKPGDWGEDTISIHVDNNDAYACAYIDITKNDDMSSTEPELEAGDQQEDPGNIMDGELAQNLNFFFWLDDGDNVYESGELPLMEGPASDGIGVLTYDLRHPNTTNGELIGGETYYIGKVWCYGNLLVTGVAGDDTGPLERHSGISCNGESVSNMSQSDNMMVDMSFYAEQARHNSQFTCPVYQGTTMTVLDLENKDGSWNVIIDDTYGTMVYSASPTFYGTVVAQGLEANSKYQITLNGPGDCNDTDDLLASAGSNLFESGYWNSAGDNLQSTCAGDYGEGVYNMNLVGNHYTVMTNSLGEFNYAFNLALPSGNYAGVKVLVKKMLNTHVSPWVDSTVEYTTNLFETAPITFIID